MEPTDSFAQMLKQLDGYTVSVGYQPLAQEADYRKAPLPDYLREARKTISQDRHADPFQLRDECIHGLPKNLCVFVPGQMFDVLGTRQGRGGGWYDRFLSHIPDTWVIIGVGKKETFSTTPITKQSWDVGMDWVIVEDSEGHWEAYRTINPLRN